MRKMRNRILAAMLAGVLTVSGAPLQISGGTVTGIAAEKAQTGFTYRKDFAEGLGNFTRVSANGTLKAENGAACMEGNGIFVDQDSVSAKNTEVEFTFNPKSTNCNYGVILRYVSPQEYLYVGPSAQNNQHYTKWAVYNQSGKLADINDAGFILDGRETPYKVKVRAVNKVITVFVDNEMIYSAKVNAVTDKAGKVGFRTTQSSGMTVYEFTQRDAAELTESSARQRTLAIASPEMTVTMDAAYPRVLSYALAGGGSALGQEKAFYQVEINNRIYENPTVTVSAGADTATYHLEVTGDGVSYAFDVVYTVSGNTLDMRIKHIEDAQDKIYTINFPEQYMVAMSGTAANGKLRVNNYQNETVSNLASLAVQEGFSETTLAVLSCDNAAAAMSGESYKNRKEIAYKTTEHNGHKTTGLWLNEFTYRGVDGEIEIAEPWAKAAVVGDVNGDGKIDYQDGAVALRDLCMKRKTGAELVTSTWPMIAMNVGSEAQYPFLRILDNIKKMNLATDGFGQNVIIKGYQSEGHDAAHPDFANYNQRAGGLEDLNTLLEESEKYNAKVGVHINHTDIYPEAPQYAKLASSLSAWTWYDSSVGIIRENDALDKSAGGMDGRLAKLFDTDTKGNLDTIYVDVYFGTRWPMYKMISNITDRNMVLGTEYVDEMVSYSAFAHHINSNFGGAGNLVRLVNNDQADIFTNHQLFRGVDSRNNEQCGINGWQGAKDMNKALQAFYTKVLPNKYLANFPVMRYENDNKAVLGRAYEVVTEMVNGVNVITKNGKKVAEGNQMFIPWDPKTEEKIYHYNPAGGTSTWDLPDSWNGVTTVKLYKLSDTGRQLVNTLNVSGNKVTINAEKETGYVLCKGESAQETWSADTMDWSTGSPVKDMGFDSHSFRYWQKDAAADHIVIENNELGNSHLYIKGTKAGAVSQTLTGLIPGQAYSASVWAITEDGRKASIRVEDGETVYENHMTRSNVTYGYHHNDKYLTKAQRMAVRFVAKSDTATLTLAAEAGSSAQGKVDFDDVRVMKCDQTDAGEHTYFEDFEHVDQGLGIFVSPETDKSHLSQKNPLNPEVTPDVVDGMYSLKIKAGDYMRTLPSTVRFSPNSDYTVRLEYKASAANAFKLGVKSDKAAEAGDTANAVLASVSAPLGNMTKGVLEVKVTTGNYDDYYLDLTEQAAKEYIIDNVSVDKAKPMNAEMLRELIEKARGLKENEYTPDSWKEILQKTEQAEKVLGQGTTEKEKIAEVYQALETAIREAEVYADSAQKAVLQGRIAELKNMSSQDYVDDVNWMIFEMMLAEAQELAQYAQTTVSQIDAMLVSLEEAKNGLTARVNRKRIREIIAKAEAVSANIVVDGQELQTFLSSLTEAQKADGKAGVTEEEIVSAAEKLQDAYNAIMMKDDALRTLLADALEKTNVDAAYFTAESLEAVRIVKAKLTELWGRSGVSVREYQGVMLELEQALAGKQEKPVLSDSRKLDASAFAITCDNENERKNSEGPALLAFDGDPSTFWHSNYTPKKELPATIEIDLGAAYLLNQFSYQCRQTGTNGYVKNYDLSYQDVQTGEWKDLVTGGSFANDKSEEKVRFAPVTARKVKFVVNQGEGGFASAAELALYEKVADKNELQILVSAFDKLDLTQYTEESVEALQKLIQTANAQLADSETTQETADALAAQIKNAKEALVPKPAKTDQKALESAVRQAKQVDLSRYQNTENFRKALAEAERALVSAKTQKEVLDAAYALYLAQKEMIAGGTISSQSLTQAKVAAVANKAYTGKAICPQMQVSVGGKTLTAGVDYTVSYQNNLNPGKALAVISGKGSYSGSKTIAFKIVPKKMAIKKAVGNRKKALKVTWKKDKKADGYQVWCSLKKNFKKGVKKVVVKKNQKTSVIVKKLKSKKRYYVRVRAYKIIDGKKEYGAFSKVKKARTNETASA